jgi:hypothetical protein
MSKDNTSDPIGDIVADVYFAIIPEWVLALPVSANAIRTYCVLRRFSDNTTGECYPSRKTIAMKARLSVSTLDRAITELVDNGAITVVPRKNASGDWSSNLYTVRTFPNGGVGSPVRRPLFASEERGVITRGEGTKANKTKSINNPYIPKNYEQSQGASIGASFAIAGQTRDDLVDLCETHTAEFRDSALEAYDRRIQPKPVERTQARSETWQSKYD